MVIRPLGLADIDQLLGLIDQYDRRISPRPNLQQCEVILKQLAQNGGCVLGAFSENTLLGTCTLNICPNFSWSGRPCAIIENVIVDQDNRQQGIGTALLKHATEVARSADCYKVALMTGSKDLGTFKFYESAGFVGTKTGFSNKAQFLKKYTRIRMEYQEGDYPAEKRTTIAEAPGLRVRKFSLSEGQCVPWHYHTHITDTFFCMQGRLQIKTRSPQLTKILHPGDTFSVPPQTPHYVSGPENKGCKFIIIQGVGEYDFVATGGSET